MRRPHVYERSVPRHRRDPYEQPAADPANAALTIARAMPALIDTAEAAGLATLADLLEAVRMEAERAG